MQETRQFVAGADGTREAVLDTLVRGHPVAMPSETVYGLFADATRAVAVARIYAAKKRPMFNPLIAHCASPESAMAEGEFDESARALAAAFWPGPLTLVVPRAKIDGTICDLTCAGLDTVGLRVPETPFLRDIINGFGKPLAGPSANRSGRVSPTSANGVAEDLAGKIELIVDGGECPVGIESTIVACGNDKIRLLRPGGIPLEDLIGVVGDRITAANGAASPEAPGMMSSHYAPNAALRLNADRVHPGEALLAFGPNMPFGVTDAVEVLNLSPRGDTTRAAANLYRYIRALDRYDPVAIAVMPIPRTGLGAAISDRLRRAAAPRPNDQQDE